MQVALEVCCARGKLTFPQLCTNLRSMMSAAVPNSLPVTVSAQHQQGTRVCVVGWFKTSCLLTVQFCAGRSSAVLHSAQQAPENLCACWRSFGMAAWTGGK
jgi:hypothetical protein